MTFELTDSLLQEILRALENQEQSFIVDASSCSLADCQQNKSDEEKFYKLPEWNSDDGFSLMSDFTNQLHSPIVHQKLLEVLHSGRGVFRNFRNVLKEYPEVDKLWHIYKNRALREVINEWYNELCETWGLERLDKIPESDEDLVCEDFSFSEFDVSLHEKEIARNISTVINGSDVDCPDEVRMAFEEFFVERLENDCRKTQTGLVCHSLSEEFAGCILVKPVSDARKNVILVTNFFVSERFRGLGIGTKLISMCVSDLKSKGKSWLFMPNSIVPEIIKPLLLRNGFLKNDFGFLLKL